KLIDEFSSKIYPKGRINMYSFSNAFYYFELKDYSKSLNFINKIKMDYFIYKFDVKNLTLKIYYELGFYEEALSVIHSYRELLRKDEFLSEDRKLRHRNFIKYLRKLIIIKTSERLKEIEFFRQKLESVENLPYRRWIMDKVEELINRKGPTQKPRFYDSI
ncbi:MAG: hypothetical protein L0Y77_04425, partial [Chlorobi bacterium]|nr:hypothetical protein [Chlorobiota bacterium]